MKIDIATPYCGAVCTSMRFSIATTLHRTVVLSAPYCGAEMLIFHLSQHRIVVTFIYLPSIGSILLVFTGTKQC